MPSLRSLLVVLLVSSAFEVLGTVASHCPPQVWANLSNNKTTIRKKVVRTPLRPSHNDNPAVERVTESLLTAGYLNPTLISEGGGGTTFLAERSDTHEQCVVKVPSSNRNTDYPTASANEVSNSEKVRQNERKSGTSAVPQIRLVTVNGMPSIESEFVSRSPGSRERAPSLMERMKVKDPLGEPEPGELRSFPLETRKKILGQILDAVERAHEAGVIHRDLSPKNILVDDLGNVKIIDWGTSTATGTFLFGKESVVSGTFPYVSKEAFNSEPASPSDDLAGLRQLAWDILGAGKENESANINHILERLPFGSITASDYRYAPEVQGLDPALATAVWSRTPTSVKDLRELIAASENSQFPKTMGERLKRLSPKEIAAELLESKYLTEAFPVGLGITDPDLRREIIRELCNLHRQGNAVQKPRLFSPHTYLHYHELFKKAEAVDEVFTIVMKSQVPMDETERKTLESHATDKPDLFYPFYFKWILSRPNGFENLAKELLNSEKLRLQLGVGISANRAIQKLTLQAVIKLEAAREADQNLTPGAHHSSADYENLKRLFQRRDVQLWDEAVAKRNNEPRGPVQ